PLGYRPENVLSLNLNISKGRYVTFSDRAQFFHRVLEGIQSVPGVQSAALTESAVPPYVGFQTDFEIPGRAAAANQKTKIGLVSGDYFATVGIPLLQGRLLTDADIQRAGHYGVINDELAHIYFPEGTNPIGQRIRIPALKMKDPNILTPPGDEVIEIVGMVASARNQGIRDKPRPAIYIPYTMALVQGCVYLVRTAGDPHNFINAIREQ